MPKVGDTKAQQQLDKMMLAGMHILTAEYNSSTAANETFDVIHKLFGRLPGRDKCIQNILDHLDVL